MDGMPKHSAEGDRYAAAPRRDHLWVLVIIAVCALLEVWASWLAIGSMSGFPRIGGARGLPTDWTLAVTTEAYWGYALYSWLAAAPGPRSRAFAMWSAVSVFILSLTGQGAAHLVKPGQQPPSVLVVFVTALPVLVLALIAILVHLRQADREVIEARTRAAEKAAREAAQLRAEADERTALRAEVDRLTVALEADLSAQREQFAGELGDARAARETAQQDLETARGELAEALRRAEALTAKMATVSAQKKRSKVPASARAGSGESDPTNELLALMELQDTPKLLGVRMSGELARKIGVSPATGRRLHNKLVANGALTEYAQSLTEPLGERSQ
jgi:uncharacterized membrane protein